MQRLVGGTGKERGSRASRGTVGGIRWSEGQEEVLGSGSAVQSSMHQSAKKGRGH